MLSETLKKRCSVNHLKYLLMALIRNYTPATSIARLEAESKTFSEQYLNVNWDISQGAQYLHLSNFVSICSPSEQVGQIKGVI